MLLKSRCTGIPKVLRVHCNIAGEITIDPQMTASSFLRSACLRTLYIIFENVVIYPAFWSQRPPLPFLCLVPERQRHTHLYLPLRTTLQKLSRPEHHRLRYLSNRTHHPWSEELALAAAMNPAENLSTHRPPRAPDKKQNARVVKAAEA